MNDIALTRVILVLLSVIILVGTLITADLPPGRLILCLLGVLYLAACAIGAVFEE
jgi:hypothetical protein